MSNKFLWVMGFIVVIVLASLGVYYVYSNKVPTTGKASVKQNADTTQTTKDTGTKPVSDKKGIKRFELKAASGVNITGDGSITLKPDLTSMAVRLVTAPDLAKDQKYEVYVQLDAGSPIYAGEMFATGGKYERFLWGGAGKTEWYSAKKIMVTKRASTEAKPGTIVAEAVLPAQGESITQ